MTSRLLVIIAAALLCGACDPQGREFVGQTNGTFVLGYRPCSTETLKRVTFGAVDAQGHEHATWELVLQDGAQGVTRVSLGTVPLGYKASIPLAQAHPRPSGRLFMRVVTTTGYESGRRLDAAELRDGYVLWARGSRKGDDLNGVGKSDFGC